MKLIQQLLEMAKSSTKRAKQKKRRIKKKAETPAQANTRNLAAAAMHQMTGAGGHGTQKTKQKRGRAARREGKQQVKDY
jgi:hypothetical protein